MFARHWQIAREFTLAVAEAMPAESYDFKPTPEQLTFGRLMTHIAAQNSDSSTVATGATAVPEPQVRDKVTAISPHRDVRRVHHGVDGDAAGAVGGRSLHVPREAGARRGSALVHVYAHGASSRTGGGLPASEEHHPAGVAA